MSGFKDNAMIGSKVIAVSAALLVLMSFVVMFAFMKPPNDIKSGMLMIVYSVYLLISGWFAIHQIVNSKKFDEIIFYPILLAIINWLTLLVMALVFSKL
ncbi:MAG: hypothetical protein JWM56_900 [Candidatus Peribacteria bacterium]|nr:hypothetical protein [Candidatus Peribacteria bacterium]